MWGIEPSSQDLQSSALPDKLINLLAAVLRIELSLVVLEATSFPEGHSYLVWNVGFEPTRLSEGIYRPPVSTTHPIPHWCFGRDSNSHAFRHWNLNPARLPITPPKQFWSQDLYNLKKYKSFRSIDVTCRRQNISYKRNVLETFIQTTSRKNRNLGR